MRNHCSNFNAKKIKQKYLGNIYLNGHSPYYVSKIHVVDINVTSGKTVRLCLYSLHYAAKLSSNPYKYVVNCDKSSIMHLSKQNIALRKYKLRIGNDKFPYVN